MPFDINEIGSVKQEHMDKFHKELEDNCSSKIDFLKKLIIVDPKARLSTEEALKHLFLSPILKV